MSRRWHFNRPYIFCYYVSGHGYGHATRVNQIITELLSLPQPHTIYIISDASEFIFREVVGMGAIYRRAPIDAGVIQPLPYVIDRKATMCGVREFMARREDCVRTEAEWLNNVGCDMVLADAPFLPCVAARNAGIPCALITNFTFDEIYLKLRENDELDKEIEAAVHRITEDYRHSQLLVRLPGHINIPAFEGVKPVSPSEFFARGTGLNKRWVVDVPLVVRKAHRTRDEVLRSLGIPQSIAATHKVLLLSFGGQKEGKEGWGDCLPPGWICIVCGAGTSTLPDRFYRAPRDAYVPDLNEAADVVLGKLGYGGCSEAVAHARPFIYVPRPQFKEEEGLLHLMRSEGGCVEMPQEDFEAGKWSQYIRTAATLPGRARNAELRDNGGEIVARVLLDFLQETKKDVGVSSPASSVASSSITNRLVVLRKGVVLSAH
ncbi:uncharacterized protein VTP21DRAFT_2875 [Calcarisporiella thermophila]|uniref:uncharacterized protein n=1 Tax=Calcarisporiella thermophila TaxID=911321 RepID=UPI003741F0A7